jgi:hypothetical protein
MINTDLIYRARWDQLYSLLADGYPPLILKLLAINTIFLIYFIFKRATAKHKTRNNSAYVVQALLIGSNAVVMFTNDMMGIASHARSLVNF